MMIAALAHFYPPYRNAGSEMMLHALLMRLAADHHQVTAVITEMPEAPPTYQHGPIHVIKVRSRSAAAAQISVLRPQVIITHHQNIIPGVSMAGGLGAACVALVHNDFPATETSLRTRPPSLTVFNTAWIAARFAHLVPRHIVINPPVYAAMHATRPGNAITLINLNVHKGSEIFYALARRMPEFAFLGVIGAHGVQNIRHDIANVTITPHTTDMRTQVWSRTRILIMPSLYESYGMTALEACASGIPVIATPTPGLRESLNGGGVFIDRDDIEGWETTLRTLGTDAGAYQRASAAARARSAATDPRPQLDAWAEAVAGLRVRR